MGWNEEYRRTRSWLVERARHLVGDLDEAEDLVQEATLVWLRRQPSDDEPIQPWLRAVLKNVVRAQRRGRLRRMLREGAVVDAVEPTADDAEAMLCRREELARVRAAALSLGSPFRETLQALYWEERTAMAVATEKGLPPSTVRRRHQIGIGRLRETAL